MGLCALGIELALESSDAGVDGGLEFGVGDEGKGEVENIVGAGRDGGKVAVEEDGMEDSADNVDDGGGVDEGFNSELEWYGPWLRHDVFALLNYGGATIKSQSGLSK